MTFKQSLPGILTIIALVAVFAVYLNFGAGPGLLFGGFVAITGTMIMLEITKCERIERERQQALPRVAEPLRQHNRDGHVRTLLELSAQAVDPEKAWEFLARSCGVDHRYDSAAARQQVAAALVRNYPEGVDGHVRLLAERASLLPLVEGNYAAKKRPGRAQSQGREPLLER
jgi:hypothetical protein